jgi:hypothetical protein
VERASGIGSAPSSSLPWAQLGRTRSRRPLRSRTLRDVARSLARLVTLGSWALGSWTLVCVAGGLVSCGARAELDVPEPSPRPAGEGGAAERSCLPNCTVGHQCCWGGCSGPAVETEGACCECLDGEVDSSSCPGAVCGGPPCKGPYDGPCESHDECCGGYCEHPSGDTSEKYCLLI